MDAEEATTPLQTPAPTYGAVPKQDRESFGIFLEVLRGLLADTPYALCPRGRGYGVDRQSDEADPADDQRPGMGAEGLEILCIGVDREEDGCGH